MICRLPHSKLTSFPPSVSVPGLQQPADFMTKLTAGNTINVWVNYITNARNAVPPVTQA